MNKIKNYFVADSFTDHVFGGGPAGVLIMDEWLPDETMQNISMENNLADTAFAVRREDDDYDLRWFMPEAEINLNGHATLAAGYCIMNYIEPDRHKVIFHTKSGELSVEKDGEWLKMELPAVANKRIDITEEIVEVLGKKPAELLFGENYLAVYDSMDEVRTLKPNYEKMRSLREGYGVFVTAPGDDTCDIVGRAFWPKMGVSEDPVCGNMHCNLTPYWTKKLGKDHLISHQLSKRGAEVICSLSGNRVQLKGKVALFLKSEISIG